MDFSKNDIKRFKENLLGRIGLVPAKTTANENRDELLSAPFEWDQAIAYVYCQKCGTMPEINIKLATRLAAIGGFPLPESLTGRYFELSTCMLCSFENTGIVLKQKIKGGK